MVGSLVYTYQEIFLESSWWSSAVGGAPPAPKGNSENFLNSGGAIIQLLSTYRDNKELLRTTYKGLWYGERVSLC